MTRLCTGHLSTCGCRHPVADTNDAFVFDADIYDCANCGHLVGGHAGLDGECEESRRWSRRAPRAGARP